MLSNIFHSIFFQTHSLLPNFLQNRYPITIRSPAQFPLVLLCVLDPLLTLHELNHLISFGGTTILVSDPPCSHYQSLCLISNSHLYDAYTIIVRFLPSIRPATQFPSVLLLESY